MPQRDITLDEIIAAMTHGVTFRSYHNGTWKDGYYHSETHVFVGIVGQVVLTVTRASERYIDNL